MTPPFAAFGISPPRGTTLALGGTPSAAFRGGLLRGHWGLAAQPVGVS